MSLMLLNVIDYGVFLVIVCIVQCSPTSPSNVGFIALAC
jgi:hypothetical protein